MSKVMKREEQRVEDTWDLASIFESDDAFERELKDIEKYLDKGEKFKDGIDSKEMLLEALETEREISEKASKLYVYAHLKHDQDTSNDTYTAMEGRVRSVLVKVNTAWSFLTPTIMNIDESTLNEWAQDESLKEFKFDLEKLNAKRAHVLSDKEENILAQSSEVTGNPTQTYMMFNNADLEFPDVVDGEGNKHPLSQGTFIDHVKSDDRVRRQSAYENLYATYRGFENTISSTLQGVVSAHAFEASVRGYNSSRHQALSKNFIPESVYDNLVKTVNDNLHLLHKYTELRKRILGLDELKMYDMYTPLVRDVEFDMTYENAKEWMLKSLEPMGEEFTDIVKEGLENRWVDVYENKGKRSGAYSSGTYGTNPFILMNWTDSVNNLFTLTHEFGHSVHSYLSRKYQNSNQAGYSIFVAEVASNFNEALLADYMMKNLDDDKKKMYLLNEQLDGFRGSVFRQTMFAEFEHEIHTMKESGTPLTAGALNKLYGELNKKYFGDSVSYDDNIATEWARIPHFYMNYYVYQYSTGYAAAQSLADQVLRGGKDVAERYMNEFLKKGSSDYPINVLKNAGVDMTTTEPIENAMKVFERQLNELEALLDKAE